MIALALARLAGAATLSGTVSGDDGTPLPGVAIQVFDLRLDLEETLSGTGGTWSVSGLPDGIYRIRAVPPTDMPRVVRFYPTARDYCSADVVVVQGDDLADLDLALEAGGALSGQLFDTSGEPVPGALVIAESADGYAEGSDRGTSSAIDGTFQIEGLDAPVDGEARYRCKVVTEGWPEQYLGETYDENEAPSNGVGLGGVTSVGTHTLLDGILVNGTVTGPDGVLPSAYVHVYASSQVVTVETDSEGGYSAVGLPPGSVLAWTTPEGHALTYYPDADRPTDRVDVLEEGEVYDGLDLLPPLEAVFEAKLVGEDISSGITAMLYNDEGTVGIGTTSDAGGNVRIDGLQGGKYTLFLYASDLGYQDDYARDDAGDVLSIDIDPGVKNPEIEIRLEPGATVSGWLTDDLGEPVYGAYVIARLGEDTRTATSDRDGAYALQGLDAGRWTVEVTFAPYCASDPGYVHVYHPGVLTEAEALVLDLHTGEAMDEVDFELPRDDEHDAMGDAWEDRNGLDTSTDDSGEDPDADGFTNLEEYLLGTDPQKKGSSFGCSCKGNQAGVLAVPMGLVALQRRRRRTA